MEILFENGSKTITLEENLGPRETWQVAFQATIPKWPPTPKLINRHLGNIIASGNYTYSIDGDAYESTTTTPIPVIYTKTQ